jgi:hypothetical protein
MLININKSQIKDINKDRVNRKGEKDGMILIFVIVIIALIGMMTVIIFTLTKSDLSGASQYPRSQEAFNSTDSSIKIGALLAKSLLHPVLGNPKDLINPAISGPKNPLTVEVNHERFNLEQLVEDEEPYEYAKRYVESSLIDKNAGGKKPHLTFKVNGEIVATASVSLDRSISLYGYSLSGADRYDSAGGGNLPVDLIITVTGTTSNLGATKDEFNAPRTVITAISRDLM